MVISAAREGGKESRRAAKERSGQAGFILDAEAPLWGVEAGGGRRGAAKA